MQRLQPIYRDCAATLMSRASVAWLVLLLVFLVTLIVRWNVIQHRPLFSDLANEDATAHVLVTISALRETPPDKSHFLPIVTYGAQHNKFIQSIPWSSGMDELGNEYYASFPPLGFLAPYAVLTLLGVDATPAAIRWFGVALQLLTAGLILLLFRRLLILQQVDGAIANVTAVITATIYICLPESLKSHTLSYWHHVLLQPLWVLTLLVLLTEWWRRYWLLFVLGFLLASTEWTGYLINIAVAFAALFLYGKHRLNKYIVLVVVFITASIVAGGVMVGGYAATIGLDSYLDALRNRLQYRDANEAGLRGLAVGYAQSFNYFWVILLLFALAGNIRQLTIGRKTHDSYTVPFSQPWIIFFLLAFPAIENLLLANHAAYYSFDRLKVALPLLFMFARGVAFLDKKLVALAGVSTVLFAFLSTWDFSRNYDVDFSNPAARQSQVVGSTIRKYAQSTEIAFVNNPVGSYGTYYAGRNIVRGAKDVASVVAWLDQHGATRGALFIVGGERFGSLRNRVESLSIGAVSGVIKVEKTEEDCAYSVIVFPASYSDENWNGGISRNAGNALLVHNAEILRYLHAGDLVTDQDGAVFPVSDIEGAVATFAGTETSLENLQFIVTGRRGC